jgi:hypothetical protein
MPDTEEETYEDMTVVELREELTARDLHTSGTKDELITRLEEDDAAAEESEDEEASGDEEGTTETSTALVATKNEEEAPLIDPPRTYSPYELPANTAAAQAFVDAHPESVDETIVLPEEQQAQAEANIQDHVEQMAEFGVAVEDPRLGDYETPEPVLSSLSPESSVVGPPQNVTLSAIGENFLLDHQIGFGVWSQGEIDMGLGGEVGEPKWENTVFVSANTLTTILSAGLHPSPDAGIPVVVGVPGGTVTDAISFAFTEPPEIETEPPPEIEPEPEKE